MEVPPQREQRDEQPDAARRPHGLDPHQQAQAANSGSEKSSARIATSGPKQAGRSSSRAIASAALLRARAPRVAREQRHGAGDGGHLRDLHAATSKCTQHPEHELAERRDIRPAGARRRGVGHAVRNAAAIRDPATELREPGPVGRLHAQQRREGRDRERGEPAWARQRAQRIATAWESAHCSQRSPVSTPRLRHAPYPLAPADVNESATHTQSARGAPGGARRRRATAVLAVTARRLRARPGRALLVSAGVTVAVGFLVGVAGGSAVSEDLALRHALGSLPPAERALRIGWSGETAPGGYPALDRVAQREAGRSRDSR